ncbi:MAG: hypothetical protein MUD01_00425 [Chloroflexaceae bacterium]|nr:hypothetical protein [Chloroflexaceae bacterium]
MTDIQSLVDIQALDIPTLERLRDACNRRLLELTYTRRRTLPELLRMLDDVKRTLGDQGKEWQSLERWQWVDGDIRFWLNPKDQFSYQMGWFSIDELIAWTQNRGPVLREEEPEDEELAEDPWTVDGNVRITWLPETSNDAER